MFSPGIALFIGLRGRSNYMWFYLFLGSLTELVGFFLKHRFVWHYEFVSNIYISCEIVFYMTFFFNNLFNKKYKKIIILIIVLWQSLFWISTFIQPIFVMNTSALGLNCLVYTFLAMLVYRHILIQQEYDRLSMNPIFWINTGIFLCSSGGCLFFLLLERVLAEDTQFLITLWTTFYCIINMLRYAFIGIGLNRLARNERI